MCPRSVSSVATRFYVYYDGACSACVEQADQLRKADRRHQKLSFIDCAGDDFHDEAAERDGLTQAALLRTIHVRSSDGTWFRGAEAIAEIYESQEMKRTARFWKSPVAHLAYQSLIFVRPLLTRVGGGKLASRLVRRQAERLNRDQSESSD